MSDTYTGHASVPVDTYVNRELARMPAFNRDRCWHDAELVDRESPKAYKVRKVIADKGAIDNYNALPRPKSPPGRP